MLFFLNFILKKNMNNLRVKYQTHIIKNKFKVIQMEGVISIDN
jgi:hypothetical protein